MIALRRTLITMFAGAWLYNMWVDVSQKDFWHKFTGYAIVFVLIWIGYELGRGDVDNERPK